MEINELIINLVNKLESYISTISTKILEYTPYIIEVGALTVGTDNSGAVIVENVNFPTQFSESAVNEILTMTFRNGNNEIIKPKVYGKIEWYSKEIENIKLVLLDLRSVNK